MIISFGKQTGKPERGRTRESLVVVTGVLFWEVDVADWSRTPTDSTADTTKLMVQVK